MKCMCFKSTYTADEPGGKCLCTASSGADCPVPSLIDEPVSYGETNPLDRKETGIVEGEVRGTSEPDGEEIYPDLDEIQSTLFYYFKTVSRYPLLTEEQERGLAKQIKDNEEICLKLVNRWKRLFKKELKRGKTSMRSKERAQKWQHLDELCTVFNSLIRLQKKRSTITSALKHHSKRSPVRRRLEEELYKVETALSRGIAEIRVDQMHGRLIWNVRKALHRKKTTTSQGFSLDKELATTLERIGSISREIKHLKNELVQANLRLVISIAKRYPQAGLPLTDLIQEGNLGLIRAIDTYDYRRGHRFITYAIWWIRQAIIRALDCQVRTVRMPVYINEKLTQINKTSSRLFQEYQREPTLEEVAQETETPKELLEKVVLSARDEVSLNTLVKEKGEGEFNPIPEGEGSSVMMQAISSNLSQMVEQVLSDLTPREEEVIRLRFGIGVTHDHTLEEIGAKFNLSRERIRQILENALGKLRVPGRAIKLREFVDLN